MKKVIIFAIVLINLSAIYFWNFPYISKTDLITYRLTDKALKRQNEIIGVGVENNIKSIKKNIELDSTFSKDLTCVENVHKSSENCYAALQEVRDLMIGELKQEFAFRWRADTAWAYGLINRLKPFHYQIPNQILFKNKELSTVAILIDEQQKMILKQIENDAFRQVIRDSFLIKTANLEMQFSAVHLQKTLTLISGLQNQMKVLDYQFSAFLLSELKRKQDESHYLYESFTPIIHTETPIVKKGESFKAEIFAVTYSKNPSTKITVNGNEIPVENGIGTYTVKTSSTGRKKFTVRCWITNPLTRETKSYIKEFIYDVIQKQD